MTEISTIFINFLLMLSTIPIHEYGHYYSARLMGLKAKLNLRRAQVW